MQRHFVNRSNPSLLQVAKEKEDLKNSLAQSMDENMQLAMEKNQLQAQMTELNRCVLILVVHYQLPDYGFLSSLKAAMTSVLQGVNSVANGIPAFQPTPSPFPETNTLGMGEANPSTSTTPSRQPAANGRNPNPVTGTAVNGNDHAALLSAIDVSITRTPGGICSSFFCDSGIFDACAYTHN